MTGTTEECFVHLSLRYQAEDFLSNDIHADNKKADGKAVRFSSAQGI
jgi:hypothetical protein